MDMTATSFPDASFGLVLDKGGLDALMGDGDAGSQETGEKLLREVDRLLRPGDGAYVCVTLAQEHVLGAQRWWTECGLVQSELLIWHDRQSYIFYQAAENQCTQSRF